MIATPIPNLNLKDPINHIVMNIPPNSTTPLYIHNQVVHNQNGDIMCYWCKTNNATHSEERFSYSHPEWRQHGRQVYEIIPICTKCEVERNGLQG